MSLDSVKDRIRKLMAYANDGAASDGEIENAMRHAARLIDQHHLDAADFETKDGGDEKPIAFGQYGTATTTTRLATWESTLGAAICNLFGTVKWWIDSSETIIRKNGVAQLDAKGNPRRGKRVVFYGPVEDAAEAGQLFTEWALLIASMGVVRWGGAYRGDGAMYCYGFATALLEKSKQIREDRRLVPANPITPRMLPDKCAESKTAANVTALAIKHGTAVTLKDRYESIQAAAKEWLQEDQGVKLSSAGSRTGYSAGSGAALREGRAHGSAASFGRAAKRKLLA